ncbi:nicotinate-nucleotide--dimethylbenzimidazole phosphoribosyltransferase [Streptomyces sp. MMBL 11-3]|uniref:nicotinate-nucleotide--dimethylbenzimidazole phosphoribosyltransferase n=1 Tax=Streptomyces sp. MMBL 11-3 TaxID=3382639 RepID=UPI0039B60CEC
MTDTGQVPGEGLPENAGMVEQPGVPAPGAYTYLSGPTAEDEDLLLPGAQGAWGNEVAPPAPAPVVEAVHEPGPHETAGRDSGSVDLSAVRMSSSAPQPPVARRPLHLGPPIPDGAGSPVRSLADRGPAGAPSAFPVRQAASAPAGPEYLDVPRDEAAPQGAAPWGAQAQAQVQTQVRVAPPVAQVGPEGAAAETVFPQGAGTHPDGPADTGSVPVPAPAEAPVAVAEQPDGAVQAQDAPGAAPFPVAAQAQVPDPAQGQFAEGAQAWPADAVQAGGAAPAADAQVADAAQAQAAVDPAEAAGQVPEPAQGPGLAFVPPQPEDAQAAGEQLTPDQQVPGHPTAEQAAPEQADSGQAVAGQPASEEPVPGQEASDQAASEQVVHGQMTPEQAAFEQPASEQPASEQLTSEQPAGIAQVPEAVPVPAAVPVPDWGQAPLLADGSLFPQAPEEPQGPEFAQAVPEFPQAPDAAPLPPQPAVVHFPHPSPQDAGLQVPEVQEVQEAAPEAQQVPQAQDAAPSFLPGPVQPAALQEPQPQAPPEAEPAVAEAVQVQDAAESPVPEGAVAPAGPVDATAPGAGDPDAAQAAPAGTADAPPAAHAVPVEGAEPQGDPALLQEEPPQTEQPVGQFVAVEGVVPTTPHLAPTPPHGLTLPASAEESPEQPATAQPGQLTAEQPAAEHSTAEHPVAEAADPAAALVEQPAPESAPEAAPDPAPEPESGVPAEEEPLFVLPAPPESEPVPEAGAESVQEAPAEDGAPEPVAAQQPQDPDPVIAATAAGQDEDPAAAAPARQSTGPAAPGYDDAEREAVLRVMRERRDIRNGFRSDPIPHDVLLRVLEAAHTAPSVGHSQPWDFVVIKSAETRRAMHELAARQREAYAKSLPKGRAKQFKELKIEAILDTPVNIVVTADPTRGGRHTLGRHTQPQMAPYSSALAVENLWLAARAEGLGVGWVSFFDEREMVRELGLPEHLEVVAYLCVGYVDEFPEEPELMQAGWSKRRPLSWVVHEETYGRRALPGEDPHDLLAETITNIRPLDAKALGEAWERQKRMTKPAGALGMLEIISAQLSGLSRMCPPPIPEPAAVAVFAGDHGVHAQGVTPWPQEVTGQMVANILGGGAVCNAFATQVGAEVCVVDVGVASDLPATPGLLPRKVRAGTADMTTGPALTREEVRAAVDVGIETARDLVAAGNKALITGEMGIANTTASAALISVFTGADPAEVTGRGTGINDETLARKTDVVRRALELHQPDPADPIGVLAAVGGLEHAAMVGLLLGGASLRTPVILDGVSAGAAALVARAIAPEVLAACIAGHRSAEPGHVAALNKLGLRPLVDLDLRLGEGTGALLALPVVQSAARAMHEVATFDSAGVTEK